MTRDPSVTLAGLTPAARARKFIATFFNANARLIEICTYRCASGFESRIAAQAFRLEECTTTSSAKTLVVL